MKTKYQILTAALALLVASPALAQKTTGIDSVTLIIECKGDLEVKGYSDVSVSSGFIDRAGKYHPPQGYAQLQQKVVKASAGCAQLKSKLGIDVMAESFPTFFSTKSTDEHLIAQEAAAEIGKQSPFNAKQSFTYQDENGFLPFFPLMHEESVYMAGRNFKVDTAKMYNIYLYEEDKVQLNEMMFAYLEQNGYQTILSSQLIYALTLHHPEFESNFKIYLPKLLAVFTDLQTAFNPAEKFTGFSLHNMAANINGLTNQYPEYYQFNIPQLVAEHPAMLSVYSDDKAKAFPNMSAQDLEKAIDLIEQALAQGTMHPYVKLSHEETLKYMAAYYAPGNKLTQISSTYTSNKAKALLKSYYSK